MDKSYEILGPQSREIDMTHRDQDLDETTIGYKIDAAYRRADMYAAGSDNWHYWMDEAKRLEGLVTEPAYR